MEHRVGRVEFGSPVGGAGLPAGVVAAEHLTSGGGHGRVAALAAQGGDLHLRDKRVHRMQPP